MTLSARTGNAAMAAEAAAQIETACDATRKGGRGPFAAHCERQLQQAGALLFSLAR